MEPKTNDADVPLTSEHLRAAALWAIEARHQIRPIDGLDIDRMYAQKYWDGGTACCVHGAAHLFARGKPTGIGPDECDYRDLSPGTRRAIINELWDGSSPGAPERILAILDLEQGSGGNS